MQLPTKDGIKCDGCGLQFNEDFTYYSIDFRSAKSKFGQHLSLRDLDSSPMVDTFDYCSLCYEKLQEKIVEINQKTSQKTGSRYCDLSGQDLMLLKNYYYATVTGATVKQTGVPFTCEQCGLQAHSPTTVCKCGSVKYVRKADVHTDKKLIEIFLTPEIFNSFAVRKEKYKHQEGNNWNVTS